MDTKSIEISPFVKSISSGIKLSHDLDYKKEYYDYRAEKLQEAIVNELEIGEKSNMIKDFDRKKHLKELHVKHLK